MASVDRYDNLILKASGQKSDRHDEAFSKSWDILKQGGFSEGFSRGKNRAQAERREMPFAAR